MMQSIEGQFPGAGGIRLFYRYYDNPAAKDTLIILHGHGEHSGRYEKFPKILEERNLSIAVYDGRGYGRSEGPEVHVDSFEEFLEDLTAFFDFLKKSGRLKGRVYLLGHSLGGLVAVHWTVRFPEKIQGLFLSSPFLGLDLPAPLIWINAFINRINPRFVYQNPVYPPHLTHNPEEVRNYKADQLIKRKISVRLLSEVLRYQAKISALKQIRFPFPVYVLAAGLEKVVDLRCTRAFFEKVEAPCKKMEIFDGFYHEIFNELEQEKAFDFLKSCIADVQTRT